MTHKYGTKEYYKECFADFLGDCGTGDANDTETALNVLAAFREAVQDWIDYHEHCAQTYTTLMHTFLDNQWDAAYGPTGEELDLPEIPDFPSLLK